MNLNPPHGAYAPLLTETVRVVQTRDGVREDFVARGFVGQPTALADNIGGAQFGDQVSRAVTFRAADLLHPLVRSADIILRRGQKDEEWTAQSVQLLGDLVCATITREEVPNG